MKLTEHIIYGIIDKYGKRAVSMLYTVLSFKLILHRYNHAVSFLKCCQSLTIRQTCDFSTTARTLSCMVDAMRYCSGEVF